MRALTGGSIVLGFAIVLVSWDASRRFTHVQLRSAMPSVESGVGMPRPSPAHRNAPAAAKVDAPTSDVVPSGTTPVDVTRSRTPQGRDDPRSVTPAKRFVENAALPVREFPRGSKAHVEAIATALDSEDSRKTVAPVARLYFAFFDRAADYEGLNYYIEERDGGSSLAAIATEFAGSDEFRIRYGALDNAAFVDRIYRNIFDAVPDPANRAYWIAQLDSGMSRGQVMVAFSESNAFRAASGNEVFVSMAFAEALRRAPDPDEFARWVRFLDAGKPREALIAGLLGGGAARR